MSEVHRFVLEWPHQIHHHLREPHPAHFLMISVYQSLILVCFFFLSVYFHQFIDEYSNKIKKDWVFFFRSCSLRVTRTNTSSIRVKYSIYLWDSIAFTFSLRSLDEKCESAFKVSDKKKLGENQLFRLDHRPLKYWWKRNGVIYLLLA